MEIRGKSYLRQPFSGFGSVALPENGPGGNW